MRKLLPIAASLAAGVPAAIFLALPASATPAPAPATPNCATVMVTAEHGRQAEPFRVCGSMVRIPVKGAHWLCKLTKGTPGKDASAATCRAWTDSPG